MDKANGGSHGRPLQECVFGLEREIGRRRKRGMWVTRENVCARCHRKCVTKLRQAHAAQRDEDGVYFPLKASCATCAHACVCVHVEQCGPYSPLLFLSNLYVIVFHCQLIAMSLSFHPPSHQVSLAVNCEDKSSHPPVRLRTIGVLLQQGWSGNRQ